MASSSMTREKPRVFPRVSKTRGSTNTKKSFPWITRSGEKLHVSTLKPLQDSTFASYKFLNFTTILGPARQGKSFLMNCLLGNNAFHTTDSLGVCTKGIQVAGVVHEVGDGGCAFFVDTEGQGDEDVDSDATLLTPILLLSKVILFNWKGGLQKSKILDELAILVEVANCVSSNSFEEDTPIFGHLHIILRDFHFQGTAEEAFAMIFDEEIIRDKKVKERNKIREKLRSSFESIKVSVFPVPCEDVQDLDPSTTSNEFQKSVRQLKDTILGEISQPRRFGSLVVSCHNVDFLVRNFVKELEDGDIVHVKSAISQLQRKIVDEAKHSFEKSLVKAYKEIGVPLRAGLEELLAQKKDTLLDAFRNSTAKVDLETIYREDVLEHLDRFADRELDAKRKENLLAIQSKMAEQNATLATAEEEFRSSMESELRKGEERSSRMQQHLKESKQRLVDDFLNKTAGLDWVPQREKKLEDLKAWASVRLDEKVKAKKKEEEYIEKSEQQNCLAKAAEDFRTGIKNWLRKDGQTNTSNLRQNFQQEKENLTKNFRKSTDRLHRISQQREAEFEKLKSWADRKIEEKIQAVEKEKRFMQKEQELSRQRMVEALGQSLVQSSYNGLPDFLGYHTPPAFPSSYSSVPPSSYSPAFPSSYSSVPPSGYSPASPPSYSPASLPSYTPATPPSISGLKFYKGGQFTPGGGRAPSGGCYMSPASGFSSSSSSPSSRSLGPSSSGGRTFYKGGQFTPGGGRAPKGGCWK